MEDQLPSNLTEEVLLKDSVEHHLITEFWLLDIAFLKNIGLWRIHGEQVGVKRDISEFLWTVMEREFAEFYKITHIQIESEGDFWFIFTLID